MRRRTLLAACAVALSAAGCSAALNLGSWRPAAPLPVHIYSTETEDADAAAMLALAEEEVKGRVARRDRWFRVVEDRTEAAVVLRLTRYSVERLRPQQNDGNSETIRTHFVDALATIGDARQRITGIDSREVNFDRLEYAASQLVDELERFCRENQALLGPAPSG